jgi:hypothetical protein
MSGSFVFAKWRVRFQAGEQYANKPWIAVVERNQNRRNRQVDESMDAQRRLGDEDFELLKFLKQPFL